MRRGLPTLLALLVIFIVLAVLVIIQEPRTPSALEPTPQPTDQTKGFGENRVYINLDGDAIQAIRLLDPHSGQSVTFARNPIRFWTAPFIENVTLDQTVMGYIERTLELMPYAHQFIPQAERLTEYGFLPDGRHYFSVLFTMDDGTIHTIAIGNPTEYGGRAVYYAVVDEREEMYLIYREPIDYLIEQFLKPPIVS